MDPIANVAQMRRALLANDRDTFAELHVALAEWIGRGGFSPDLAALDAVEANASRYGWLRRSERITCQCVRLRTRCLIHHTGI